MPDARASRNEHVTALPLSSSERVEMMFGVTRTWTATSVEFRDGGNPGYHEKNATQPGLSVRSRKAWKSLEGYNHYMFRAGMAI